MYLSDLFDSSLKMYSYDSFLSTFNFPINVKEFSVVTNAIPSGLIHLMCSHLTYYTVDNKDYNFLINGKNVFDTKCTNKDIRQVFNEKNRVIPKGKFHWNSILRDVNRRKAWLLPYKFYISNKVREIHLKISHKLYPTNTLLSKCMILRKKL